MLQPRRLLFEYSEQIRYTPEVPGGLPQVHAFITEIRLRPSCWACNVFAGLSRTMVVPLELRRVPKEGLVVKRRSEPIQYRHSS